jgi:hypothetical protein
MTVELSEPVTGDGEPQLPRLRVRVDPLLRLPFSQLLRWTQSLRNQQCRPQSSLGGKQQHTNHLRSENESKSLRSLVSIHNSILRAVWEGSSVVETGFDHPETQDIIFTVDSESLETECSDVWTVLLRTEEDKRIARRLWSSPIDPFDVTYDLDAQRLLMVQYGFMCVHPVVTSFKEDSAVGRDDPSSLSHSFALLRTLILPLCLVQPISGTPSTSVDDIVPNASATFSGVSSITDDLLNAMLDAVFSNIETNPSERLLHEVKHHELCLQQQWLALCLNRIVAAVRLHYSVESGRLKKTSAHVEHCWRSSCRIVRRLGSVLKFSSNTEVLSSVGTLCIVAIDFVASCGRGSQNESKAGRIQISLHEYDNEPSLVLSGILRPIVMDLLPVLTDALDNDVSSNQFHAALSEVRRLWTVLWNHYNNDFGRHCQSLAINDTSGSYIQQPWYSMTTPISCVVTSILCTILPSLVRIPLPVTQPPSFANDTHSEFPAASTNADYIPIFHQNLWEMILRCLRLGLSYHVDHRGRRRSSMPGTTTSAAFSPDTIRMHQLHRRRGLYILRLLVENFDPNKASILPSEDNGKTLMRNLVLWRKYVACFETLEMESDQHLIDQVWETVTELFDQMVPLGNQNSPQPHAVCTFPANSTIFSLPSLTWDWMQVMLGRVLVSHESPVLRKLSLFRLFKGQAGIRCDVNADFVINDLTTNASELTIASTKNKSRRKAKSKPRGASLLVVSVDFLFTVVLFSFDTLLSSVGTNMQATAAVLSHAGTSGSKSQVAVAEEMIPLCCRFLSHYLQLLLVESDSTSSDDSELLLNDKLEQFFRRLWSPDVLDGVHHKVTVSIFESVSSALQDFDGGSRKLVPIHCDMLRLVSESLQLSFSDGSMVTAYKDSLLRSLATILSYSKVVGKHNAQSILSVLALYPSRMLDQTDSIGDVVRSASLRDAALPEVTGNPTLKVLSSWLNEEVSASAKTGINVGATIATAFVDGMMATPLSKESIWNPKAGCTNSERKFAKAIALYCILPTSFENQSAAGELLWPAIHKGVSHVSAVIVANKSSKADHISRALLLLEYGVRFCALSGLGNGELVVDKKTQNMLPPLQKIDVLLGSCVNFILFHVKSLFIASNGTPADDVAEVSGSASRSSDARVFSMTFARLVCQIQYLVHGFPSSQTIAPILTSALKESIDILCSGDCKSDGENICLHVAIVYITLASGCEMNSVINISSAKTLLHLHFQYGGRTIPGSVQALRSVFQFAKWGALSRMVPLVLTSKSIDRSCNDIDQFIDDITGSAIDAVEASPSTALVPLFDSIVAVANFRFVEPVGNQMETNSSDSAQFSRLILALLDLVDGCDSNADSVSMIDKVCALLFQPTLLLHEYRRIQENPNDESPIREAFRRLVRFSGTERPHISRIVLSRACTGWLKCNEVGVSGIPYRDEIVQLLVHKEDIVPVTSSFTTSQVKSGHDDRMSLLPNTDETCVSRGFLLVFLSKLPDVGKGLSSSVLRDLLHYVVLKLVELVTLAPTSSSGLIMYGVSVSQCRLCATLVFVV